MSKVTTTLGWTLLVTLGTACQLGDQFQDFSSNGSEYAPLENLRLKAEGIVYAGSEGVSILDETGAASKYLVVANVEVQTACLEGVGAYYERAPANFEIYVIEDRDRYFHNKIVQMIYDVWSKNERFSGKYFFDFTVEHSNYVLAVIPDAVNIRHYYFAWINNRIIKVVFAGFKHRAQSGWGMMDSFTSENLRLQATGSAFKVYDGFPRDKQQIRNFLALHQRGFFQR